MDSKTPLDANEMNWFMYGYCYRLAEELQEKGIYSGLDKKDVITILLQEIIYELENKK